MSERTPAENDVATELADFRRRVLAKEEIPDEELQAAIQKLRTFREKTAKPVVEKKAVKTVKKATKKEVDDFFGDLL